MENQNFIDAPLSLDQLEEHANAIAVSKTKFREMKQINLEVCKKIITKAYSTFADAQKQGFELPAANWIVDNFHVLEYNIKILQSESTPLKLPCVFGNIPRVYTIATEIVAHTEGKISRETIGRFLQGYQKKAPLMMRELHALQSMLKVALIKFCATLCKQTTFALAQHQNAKQIATTLNTSATTFSQAIKKANYTDKYFIEKLVTYVDAGAKINSFSAKLALSGIDVKNATSQAISAQVHCAKLMQNVITSIRFLEREDWDEIFQENSLVEKILKKDQIYQNMCSDSRAYYRSCVERVAKKTRVAESFVCDQCVFLAKNEPKEGETKKNHVGYFLCGGGIEALYALLGYKIKARQQTSFKIFFFSNLALAAILFALSGFLFQKTFVLLVIPALICVASISKNIIQKVLSNLPRKCVPRLSLSEGISNDQKTLITIPAMVSNHQSAKKLCDQLEVYFLATRENNVYYALLCDFVPHEKQQHINDSAIVETVEKTVAALNKKHGEVFFCLFRNRAKTSENNWCGKERKRGAIQSLCKLILFGEIGDFISKTISDLPEKNIKYILTLDADTVLPIGCAKKLVAAIAHPLNKAQKIGENIAGYSVVAPRVEHEACSANKTGYSSLFATPAGQESYSSTSSEMYQDAFAQGNFAGKGIFDVADFESFCSDIPKNTVLSHDLLEGTLCGCGFAGDIVIYEEFPQTFAANLSRKHRWARGDVQLLPFVFNKKMPPVGRFKMFDNIRAVLFEPSVLILLVGSIFQRNARLAIFAATTFFAGELIEFFSALFGAKDVSIRVADVFFEAKEIFKRALYNASTLCINAHSKLDAFIRAIYRSFVSHKNMLEWTTAADFGAKNNAQNNLRNYYKTYWVASVFCVFLFGFAIFAKNYLLLGLCVFWFCAPILIKKIDEEIVCEKLNKDSKAFVEQSAQDMWKFFQENLNAKNNFLPPDNVQIDPHRTFQAATSSSPTNIGLALVSTICAQILGFLQKHETIEILEKTMGSVEKLEKWNGLLYNWYNIQTLQKLEPAFVSSVDCGNYIACLIVVKQYLQEILNEKPNQINQIDQSDEEIENYVDFAQTKLVLEKLKTQLENSKIEKLYDEKNNLFHVGWDENNNLLTDSHYDLLASEARILSFCAIALFKVAPKHWSALSRMLSVSQSNKNRILLSWSGTMFEYFMPLLFMKNIKNTLLGESVSSCFEIQKKYAQQRPFGISESGYVEFDTEMNYQYRAFGVPRTGLKTQRDQYVVSPYSSFLSLAIAPNESAKNLQNIKNVGGYGKYGFYEAIDYTKTRVRKGDFSIVKSFMSHHVGMSFVAATNAVSNNKIVELFHSMPEIRSAQEMIFERKPKRTIVLREYESAIKQQNAQQGAVAYNEIETNQTLSSDFFAQKQLCVLSEKADLYAFNDGRSVAKFNGINFYAKQEKYSAELRCPNIFLKNVENQKVTNICNGKTEFTTGAAIFNGSFEGVETTMSLCSSPSQAMEIRKITLENKTQTNLSLELFYYCEVAMMNDEELCAHKIYHKLFIESWAQNPGQIVFKKRAKGHAKDLFLLAHWSEENVFVCNNRFDALARGKNNAFIDQKVFEIYSAPLEPCVVFKQNICLAPFEKKTIGCALAMGYDLDALKASVDALSGTQAYDQALEIAWISSQVRTKHLGVSGEKIKKLRKLGAAVFDGYSNRARNSHFVFQNKLPKNEIWKFGISGDLPIVLSSVATQKEVENVVDFFALHKYLKMHGLVFDIIIVNEEQQNYHAPIYNQIVESASRFSVPLCKNGGLYVLQKQTLSKEDICLLYANCSMFWEPGEGEDQLNNTKIVPQKNAIFGRGKEALALETLGVEKFNSWGGFSKDSSYTIDIVKGNVPPLPWSHIMANENFGTLVTQSGGGYTWGKNSSEEKLTIWSNDPIYDTSSEAIFLRDENTKRAWSITQAPLANSSGEYRAVYSKGYCEFFCGAQSLHQKVTQFVDVEKSVKISILNIKNPFLTPRQISVYYFADFIIGKTKSNALCAYWSKNALIAQNGGQQKVYIAIPANKTKFTTSKESFCAQNFSGLYSQELRSSIGVGNDCCCVLKTTVTIGGGGESEIVLIMGSEKSEAEINDVVCEFSSVESAKNALEKAKQFWQEKLGKITLKSSNFALDRLFNKSLLYQTYCSRLLGRTAFYQAGGAFGFRDQLQDVLALLLSDPERAKKQILLCCAHQFIAGDVQHWWHEGIGGVRTRISDDLLFLPFVACEYSTVTEDFSIWEQDVAFLEEIDFPQNQKDVYANVPQSSVVKSVFEHCVAAIDFCVWGNGFGQNGLPKMGGGDWNDGMDEISGESVWLGWFLVRVLDEFIPVCEKLQLNKNIINNTAQTKIQELVKKYIEVKNNLFANIQKNAWDGQWFKRAFFKDGTAVGSSKNSECKIDAISQSWSVLCEKEFFQNEGAKEKSTQAMQSFYDYLLDKKTSIIKVLTPPFNKSNPCPGYIQSYVPGVRENGGQYTHGVVWGVIAFIKLGDYEKAFDLLQALNPINHSDNQICANIYKGEPYAMAADVYSNSEHLGRAGWTWYTGAAAWTYVAILEFVGFKKRGTKLFLNNNAAQVIGDYCIEYKHENTIYKIRFLKQNKNCKKTVELAEQKYNGGEQTAQEKIIEIFV